MSQSSLAPPLGKPKLAFPELVAITAGVMALNALAIDMMLPALNIIGTELKAGDSNQQQLVVGVYILGNGIAQLFFGPVADRFGRRRVLLFALGGYLAGSLLSVLAGSFSLLLAARAFQGISTAAARVSVIAAVRDQCAGRQMARVMSLAITIFMAAPILAPGFGQLILFSFPWRGIFVALFLYGAVIALWVFLRVPETIALEDRRPLNPSKIASSYWEFFSNRTSAGYTIASALCFGALFGYIAASEQIFREVFDAGEYFVIYFGLVAAALGAATLTNARLVETLGMRRISHGAVLVFILANLMHLAIAMTIGESLPIFVFFMCVAFFAIGLIGPNSSALAMEPMGHIAGSAAAANGFAGTTVAGGLGTLIGLFYDGTTLPIVLGFAILGIASLAVMLWVENGVLFQIGEEGENTPLAAPLPAKAASQSETPGDDGDIGWLDDGEQNTTGKP